MNNHIALYAMLQIVSPMEWVNEPVVLRHGNGVDSEITASQILFQRYRGICKYLEARMSGCSFPFAAGEGIFFFGDWMQKHGKIPAHLLKSQRHGMDLAVGNPAVMCDMPDWEGDITPPLS